MEIRIERLRLEFAEDIAKALNDERIRNNLRDLPSPYTVNDANEFINYAISADENEEFIFAITLNDKFIGRISATRQKNIHRFTAETGYYIIPEYWGKGVATQAVKALTEFIFRNTDVVRLFAEPFERNAASCRVLEKAGFTCEGTLRKNALKCGVFEDMKIYSLLKN